MKKTDLNWETPILGVIGGMGPMATELFYKMIIEKTPVTCDQEHLDTIILGHASMPDRTAAILSKDPQRIRETAQKMLSDAKTLETLGADCIAVTCNTAHYFVDQIADQVSIPFIHMIKETAKAAAAACPAKRSVFSRQTAQSELSFIKRL